uniref:Uncharacterized protein n=1 Tax=Oryza punctata TaxID=4537 RepID=A0A0E0M4H6_ORYPU
MAAPRRGVQRAGVAAVCGRPPWGGTTAVSRILEDLNAIDRLARTKPQFRWHRPPSAFGMEH